MGTEANCEGSGWNFRRLERISPILHRLHKCLITFKQSSTNRLVVSPIDPSLHTCSFLDDLMTVNFTEGSSAAAELPLVSTMFACQRSVTFLKRNSFVCIVEIAFMYQGKEYSFEAISETKKCSLDKLTANDSMIWRVKFS